MAILLGPFLSVETGLLGLRTGLGIADSPCVAMIVTPDRLDKNCVGSALATSRFRPAKSLKTIVIDQLLRLGVVYDS